MAAELVTISKEITRPLKLLVPLIKKDLEQAKVAADEAAMPYYKAAGEKMWEAKGQIGHGGFEAWVKRNFGIGRRQASLYMQYAKHEMSSTDSHLGKPQPSTLREFVRDHTTNKRFGDKSAWRETIDAATSRHNIEAMRQDQLAQDKERALQKKMALQIIQIGYKVLASKLHPDKGGTREAMARLNTVRNRLKDCA